MDLKAKIFIDEVGNSDLKAAQNPIERFISLSGIVLRERHYYEKFVPVFRDLKRQFFQDESIIFHRREMLRALDPFHILKDQELRERFDTSLIRAVKELPFGIFTVVVDKLSLQGQGFRGDPYHLAFFALMEEYLVWLKDQGLTGDVTVEMRGKGQDQSLKRAFASSLSENHLPEALTARLTSRSLKFAMKSDNCPAMQLADLLAYPSAMSIRSVVEAQHRNQKFTARIVEVLERSKYPTAGAKRLIP